MPYDPIAIADSLTRIAPTPPPDFSDLESELMKFEPSDRSGLETILADWRRARARVDALADSLSDLGRTSPQYASAYERFRQMYGQLLEAEAGHERRFRELAGRDRELAVRAAQAADSVRAWQARHLEAFNRVVETALERNGLPETQGATGDTGNLEIGLPPGKWWAVARIPHPNNPFAEYVWHVPVTTNRLVPVRALLGDHNVRLKWRY